jgi:protein ImuB
VLDDDGRPVRVTDRGAVPMPPAQFGFDDGSTTIAITSWAGPWPVDERWWDPASARHVARFQLVDVQGRAYLVSCEMGAGNGPRWQLEACYD